MERVHGGCLELHYQHDQEKPGGDGVVPPTSQFSPLAHSRVIVCLWGGVLEIGVPTYLSPCPELEGKGILQCQSLRPFLVTLSFLLFFLGEY